MHVDQVLDVLMELSGQRFLEDLQHQSRPGEGGTGIAGCSPYAAWPGHGALSVASGIPSTSW